MVEKGVLQECDTKQLAIEYYAPLFLLISVADAVENCWDLKSQLTTHVNQFVKKQKYLAYFYNAYITLLLSFLRLPQSY